MTMTTSGMKSAIIAAMEANGLNPTNGAYGEIYVQSIAEAVVSYIQANAKAVVSSGSSAGNWPIQ